MISELIITIILASFGTYVFVPITMKLARKYDVLDYPNEDRKKQKIPMPRLGGLAIIIGFAIAMAYIIITNLVCKEIVFESENLKLFVGMLLGAIVISITGFLDDKYDISAKQKFIGQIIAAVIVIAFGLRITKISIPFTTNAWILPNWFSYFITLLWIVGITNAINIIDGLDGLATGIVLIAAFSLAIVFYLSSSPLLSIFIAVAIGGGSLGFIPYNRFPAKTYLGDIGSNFLGFMLATVSLLGVGKTYVVIVMAPVLILGIPIFDTLFAMIRRAVKKKRLSAMFEADGNHIHYRLIKKGYSVRQTARMLQGITLAFALFAIIAIDGGLLKSLTYTILVCTLVYIGIDDIFPKNE